MTHTTQIAARSYTLAEVDTMREAIGYLEAIGYVRGSDLTGKLIKVEEQLRTYMMAGIDPADLEAKVVAERQRRKEYAENTKRMRAEMERTYGPPGTPPGAMHKRHFAKPPHRPLADIDRDIAAAKERLAAMPPRSD